MRLHTECHVARLRRAIGRYDRVSATLRTLVRGIANAAPLAEGLSWA